MYAAESKWVGCVVDHQEQLAQRERRSAGAGAYGDQKSTGIKRWMIMRPPRAIAPLQLSCLARLVTQ
jgi:hypothetical protein